MHRGRTCRRTRDFIDACLIKAAVDKKKRVPGDQPISGRKPRRHPRALVQLPERKGGRCVSIVLRLRPYPFSRAFVLVGSGSTIADAADGADGVFGK